MLSSLSVAKRKLSPLHSKRSHTESRVLRQLPEIIKNATVNSDSDNYHNPNSSVKYIYLSSVTETEQVSGVVGNNPKLPYLTSRSEDIISDSEKDVKNRTIVIFAFFSTNISFSVIIKIRVGSDVVEFVAKLIKCYCGSGGNIQ